MIIAWKDTQSIIIYEAWKNLVKLIDEGLLHNSSFHVKEAIDCSSEHSQALAQSQECMT